MTTETSDLFSADCAVVVGKELLAALQERDEATLQASFGGEERRLIMGSACSGSENGLCNVLGLQVAMAQSRANINMVHSFSCESDSTKRKWINTTIDNLQQADPYKVEAFCSRIKP